MNELLITWLGAYFVVSFIFYFYERIERSLLCKTYKLKRNEAWVVQSIKQYYMWIWIADKEAENFAIDSFNLFNDK